jgi:hypothetical protein
MDAALAHFSGSQIGLFCRSFLRPKANPSIATNGVFSAIDQQRLQAKSSPRLPGKRSLPAQLLKVPTAAGVRAN